MTNSLDINVLAALAKRALDEQTNGKEYMLTDVYNQTKLAYAAFPEDAVIRQFAFTIEKMLDRSNQGTTINQAQLSEIYNNFAHATQDSNFRKSLGHLVFDNRKVSENTNSDFVRLNRSDFDNGQLTNEKLADQNMVSALSVAFGGQADALKAFNHDMAKLGVDYVKAELQSLGYTKPNVEVMGGDNNTLVYAAHFNTNSGVVTVSIPINLSRGKLVLPSTFVADDKLAELSAANISYFISKKSELKDFSVPKVSDVLHAVGILTGNVKTASDGEFNESVKSFSDSGALSLSVPSLFVDRKYEDGKADIDTRASVEMPKELAHLARDFEDQMLEAASSFGKDAVNAGKSLVTIELASAQLKGAQVKYGSETNDSVIYLATINTPIGKVDIEVPVEMRKSSSKVVPLAPSKFIHDGSVMEFTGQSLQRFASELKFAPTSELTADQYKLMLLPELRNEILKSADKQNYGECEIILAHIHDRFSDEDYKNSVNDYQFALLTKNKVKTATQSKCAKMISAGHGSIHDRCGHYGVPMHLVSNDEHGHCVMKSAIERNKLNPIEDSGASISTAKIFMA